MLDCRYKGQCRIEYDTDFDVCYPCIGDRGDTCAEYEPMPDVDVDALLALAEDVEEAAAMAVVMDASKGARMLADMLLDIVRRIREACGEVVA